MLSSINQWSTDASTISSFDADLQFKSVCPSRDRANLTRISKCDTALLLLPLSFLSICRTSGKYLIRTECVFQHFIVSQSLVSHPYSIPLTMSYSSKPRILAYRDAAHILADKDVQKDVEDACRAVIKLMPDIMDKFDSISKMVHSIDMLGLTVPLRQRWDSLRRVRRCSLIFYSPTDTLSRTSPSSYGSSEPLQEIFPAA